MCIEMKSLWKSFVALQEALRSSRAWIHRSKNRSAQQVRSERSSHRTPVHRDPQERSPQGKETCRTDAQVGTGNGRGRCDGRRCTDGAGASVPCNAPKPTYVSHIYVSFIHAIPDAISDVSRYSERTDHCGAASKFRCWMWYCGFVRTANDWCYRSCHRRWQ